jgi:uncharacterized MnhB-related membrane protein
LEKFTDPSNAPIGPEWTCQVSWLIVLSVRLIRANGVTEAAVGAALVTLCVTVSM